MAELAQDVVRGIDAILQAAATEGRGSLYEHEVYGILSSLGLTVPRFVFVRTPSEVCEQTLRGFGHTLVVKVVSPAIAHKQKLGGVKKITTTDPLYVEFVLTRMREEVLEHFPADAKPSIAGFLLVEHIPHTQAIGFEVLVGFREDPAFGPVLTVSKGGDDAEFFAANYDPANLFLPPMEYPEALAFTEILQSFYFSCTISMWKPNHSANANIRAAKYFGCHACMIWLNTDCCNMIFFSNFTIFP